MYFQIFWFVSFEPEKRDLSKLLAVCSYQLQDKLFTCSKNQNTTIQN